MERVPPDLLLISDVHLGAHLKPRGRGEFVHLKDHVDRAFARFVDHYLRASRPGGLQLVVNGDFIDFWNVEVAADVTDPEARAVARLHAVLDEYPGVEEALVRLLERGDGVVFVVGNHDAEFLYPKVREALVARLEGAAHPDEASRSATRTGVVRLDALGEGRVRFVRWFLHEPGGVWIEHGHKFDPTCATPAALSPTRGGRLVPTVAEVATRSFANLVPEIDHDAPDHMSGLDYVRWALARGGRFTMRCVLLYLRMAGRILSLGLRGGRADRLGRKTHEALLERIARNANLQMSTLMALERMAPPPATATVAGVMSVVALDLILAAVLPVVVAATIAFASGLPVAYGTAAGLVVSALAVAVLLRGRTRRDVAAKMTTVASDVGRTVGVPLVLMGHSHRGQLDLVDGVLYANSGSFLDGTHLYVQRDRTGRLARVSLRRFRNGGVTELRSAPVPAPATQTVTPPSMEAQGLAPSDAVAG